MSFPINTNIPNANDYPGDDQPGMQTNFANINSYLNVDHVLAGLAGNGEHKQVTFGSNNVPTSPVTPPVLFTNIQDGAGNNLPNAISELFYYSGSATQGQNQYVSTANGSTFLFGGIILKWGNSGSIDMVSFPVAFPNKCFAVVAIGTSSLYTGGFVITGVTSSTFTIARTDGHSGATGYYYIAIGN